MGNSFAKVSQVEHLILKHSRLKIVLSDCCNQDEINQDIQLREVIRQLEKTEQELKESEERYRLLAENVTDLISRHDTEGIYLYVSPSCQSLLGYLPEELLGKSVCHFCHNDDLKILDLFSQQIHNQSVFDLLSYRMRHKNGNYIWLEVNVKIVPNSETGEVEEIICISRDITKRKQTEEALSQAESQYRSIFENITQGFFQTATEGYYLKVNPALAKLYGYNSPEELMQNITDIGNQLYVDSTRRQTIINLLEKQKLVLNFESQVYCKNGVKIWISENIRKVFDKHGNFLYYEGTVEDITYRQLTEAKFLYNSLHDSLTELPNRDWFMKQLEAAISLSYQQKNHVYAVLFIDLDGFKVINKSLGHLVGDELLKKVSNRLQFGFRSHDKVARLGGDEFAILLDNIPSIKEAINVAERIQEQLRTPFKLGDESIFIGASIGITISTIGYQFPEELLRDAHIAMYQAKAQGKDRYVVFAPRMQKAALTRLQLESDLRQGIKKQEFCLNYQPIVSLSTGKVQGFEALIRWQHPLHGWISPDKFIPIAEETGLINIIGIWVLKEACHQLRRWQQEYPSALALTMNVNLSGYQLKQIGLLEQIKSVLQETRISGKNLKLEITESCFLETIISETAIVQQLKSLGISLCIDDFGTGYSSLSRLHEFPIDTLKIDRSFINRLELNQVAIVQIIITLAHTLGMNVVAEGIETETQLKQLNALGCELGQGYLFSKPVNQEIASKLISYNYQCLYNYISN